MSDMLKAGAALPVNLGRCVDLYHDVRTLRLAMEKEVAEIQKREAEVREHIVNNLSKSDERGAVGMRYMARVKNKTVFKFLSAAPNDFGTPADGWGLFTSWVKKNDAFHFIQKRLNETSCATMLETEGRLPPGLEKMEVPDISVTKV